MEIRRNYTVFRLLNLLLLCFIHYCESSPRPVTGQKGGCVTLSCDFEDRNVSDVALSRFSKIIPICENENDGRIYKKGSCDVVIKDLHFSDAGKYVLSVYCKDQKEAERLEYQLQIHEKPDTDGQHKSWIIVSLIGALLVLVLVISALIWKYRCQNKNTEHEAVPMQVQNK